jgi:hypothetical protein
MELITQAHNVPRFLKRETERESLHRQAWNRHIAEGIAQARHVAPWKSKP